MLGGACGTALWRSSSPTLGPKGEITMLVNLLAVSLVAVLTAAGVGLIFVSLRHFPTEEE